MFTHAYKHTHGSTEPSLKRAQVSFWSLWGRSPVLLPPTNHRDRMGTEFWLKSINSSTKTGWVSLSLSLSHAYTQTPIYARFTHQRSKSILCILSICRHKNKTLFVLRVCCSSSLRGPVSFNIQPDSSRTIPRLPWDERPGVHKSISSALFIVLLALAAWNDSTMAQRAFSDWAMQGEIQIYRFGLSEPSWICGETHSGD